MNMGIAIGLVSSSTIQGRSYQHSRNTPKELYN